MRFLSIDFHLTVIEDVRHILTGMGHEVDTLHTSPRAWVVGREQAVIPGLAGMSKNQFGQAECDRFAAMESDLLSQYDGFIVTHSPCLCGLYEHTGKPVICVVSTRWHQFSWTLRAQMWLRDKLRSMHASGQLTILANNAYDAWHFEREVGILPLLIPSLCTYTGVTWTGGDEPIFHGTRSTHQTFGLRRLPDHHQWSEVGRAACCVCVPYNVSLMTIFERHSMGMPILMPSAKWLRENPESMRDLSVPNRITAVELERACELADWYSGELPGISFFDHEDEIPALLDRGVPPTHGVEERVVKIRALWEMVLERVDRSSPRRLYDRMLERLESLRKARHPHYLVGTHIEALDLILTALRAGPETSIVEFGGGHFSTPLFLAHGSRVLTIEQGANGAAEIGKNWAGEIRAAYGHHANWTFDERPGLTAWQEAEYPATDLCFVDGINGSRRKEVEFMLTRGVPVVAAHDSQQNGYFYQNVIPPENYRVFDFKGREVWTRVWSSNDRVTAAMDRHPDFYSCKKP